MRAALCEALVVRGVKQCRGPLKLCAAAATGSGKPASVSTAATSQSREGSGALSVWIGSTNRSEGNGGAGARGFFGWLWIFRILKTGGCDGRKRFDSY
jgi:hypothetical protein